MSHAQPTEAHHATLADEKLAAGAEPPATATLDRDESVEDKGSLSHNPLADLRALAEKGQVDEFGRTAIRFDAEAEARLRRKIDWHILPPVALIYLWTFIDRANIGNARLAGLERDLRLRGYDYNTLLSVFYVSYIAAEIPGTVLCKRMGPGKFLPLATVIFGILSLATAFVGHASNPFGAAIAVRFLLGAAEAPVLPGIAYYMSRWYRKDELVFRLACYIVCAPLAGAVGGLLASAILTIDNIGVVSEWELIFFIEGIVTVVVGVIGYFLVTDRIATARWLSDEERELAEARVASENPRSTAVLDQVRGKMIMQGIFNTTTLLAALAFLLDNISVQGIAFFTPTIVRQIFPNRTTVIIQLLTVPPYIAGAISVLAVPFYFQKRPRWISVVLCGTGMAVAYAMVLGSRDRKVRYAATFIGAMSAFPLGAILPGWASSNSVNDSQRAGAISTVICAGNVGGLIATWTYLPSYAPDQKPGNGLNTANGVCIVLIGLLLAFLLTRENRKRAQGKRDYRLDGLSPEGEETLAHRHPRYRLRI